MKYQIEYRIFKDANYYILISKYDKEEWSKWIKLKSTKTTSCLVNDGYIQSNNLPLLMRFKTFLERKQLQGIVKKEYKVTKIE